MSDFDDFAKRYQHVIELTAAQNRIKELEEKIVHLEGLLAASVPIVSEQNPVDFFVSDEEAICQAQINILKRRALDKELTLEETKRLEILIKSLHVIRSKVKKKEPKDINTDSVPEAELLQLAATPIKDES
jgi:hypothetical protein